MRINPDNAPEKKEAYAKRLQEMTRNELYKETEDKIWFSAYANNNPISCYHWQCDYTYTEWMRRDGKSDEYAKAWEAVRRSC